MKIKLFILALNIFAFSINMQAQDFDKFHQDLEGKKNYKEIMQVVNETYESLPTEIREKGGEGFLKEKRWRRWEWLMSFYVDEQGDLVDVPQRTLANIKSFKSQSQTLKSTNSNWFSVGPDESSYNNTQSWCKGNGIGRVNRIAFHPTNQNIMYAGLPAGGLWKTTDGGANWENLIDFAPSIGVSGIVVSSANPNEVYVLTGDGDANFGGRQQQLGLARSSAGVFKSSNAGATWSSTGDFPVTGTYFGYQLVQNSNNPEILFAATDKGIIKTVDGGDTWTLSNALPNFSDVSFRPNGNVLYATTNNATLRSLDMGVSWSNATFNINPVQGTRTFAVSPDDLSVVYLLCGPTTAFGVFNGIYKSVDSGVSYTRATNTPNILGRSNQGLDDDDQSFFDLAIAAKPTNVDLIITGGIMAWKSTNGGTTMTITSTNDDGPTNFVHGDIHDMEYNPLNGNLYACHDGGISLSTDDGLTWNTVDSGIRSTQSFHMDKVLDGQVSTTIGNQDNGIKYRRFSGFDYDYEHVARGDGFYTSMDQTNEDQFYATINSGVYQFTGSGAIRSAINPEASTFFKTVQAHNTNFDTVFASGNQKIYRSFDGGLNWTSFTSAAASWAITACPSDNNRFYCTGAIDYRDNVNGSAYRTDNVGNTWVDLSTSPGFPSNFSRLSDIAVRPTNSSQVWMTCGGFTDGQKVYFSDDRGLSWDNMTLNLPNAPIFSIAITSDNDAFVGTDVGIFYLANNKTEWIPFSNGLPNTIFTDIRIDEISNRIYASTFGRGVWTTLTPDNICEINLSLSSTQQGNRYYESGDDITSTADISSSSENNIYYKAEHGVKLSPGFKAQKNASFRAYIGDCLDGGIPNFNQEDHQESRRTLEEKTVKSNRSYFNILRKNRLLTLSITFKKSSNYEIHLMDVHQKTLKVLKGGDFDKGKINLQFEGLTENGQAYSIGLKEEGKLIYMQEL